MESKRLHHQLLIDDYNATIESLLGEAQLLKDQVQAETKKIAEIDHIKLKWFTMIKGETQKIMLSPCTNDMVITRN